MSSLRPLYSTVVKRGIRQEASYKTMLDHLARRGDLVNEAARKEAERIATDLLTAERETLNPNEDEAFTTGEMIYRRARADLHALGGRTLTLQPPFAILLSTLHQRCREQRLLDLVEMSLGDVVDPSQLVPTPSDDEYEEDHRTPRAVVLSNTAQLPQPQSLSNDPAVGGDATSPRVAPQEATSSVPVASTPVPFTVTSSLSPPSEHPVVTVEANATAPTLIPTMSTVRQSAESSASNTSGSKSIPVPAVAIIKPATVGSKIGPRPHTFAPPTDPLRTPTPPPPPRTPSPQQHDPRLLGTLPIGAPIGPPRSLIRRPRDTPTPEPAQHRTPPPKPAKRARRGAAPATAGRPGKRKQPDTPPADHMEVDDVAHSTARRHIRQSQPVRKFQRLCSSVPEFPVPPTTSDKGKSTHPVSAPRRSQQQNNPDMREREDPLSGKTALNVTRKAKAKGKANDYDRHQDDLPKTASIEEEAQYLAALALDGPIRHTARDNDGEVVYTDGMGDLFDSQGYMFSPVPDTCNRCFTLAIPCKPHVSRTARACEACSHSRVKCSFVYLVPSPFRVYWQTQMGLSTIIQQYRELQSNQTALQAEMAEMAQLLRALSSHIAAPAKLPLSSVPGPSRIVQLPSIGSLSLHAPSHADGGPRTTDVNVDCAAEDDGHNNNRTAA